MQKPLLLRDFFHLSFNISEVLCATGTIFSTRLERIIWLDDYFMNSSIWERDKTADFKRDKTADFQNRTKQPILKRTKSLIGKYKNRRFC